MKEGRRVKASDSVLGALGTTYLLSVPLKAMACAKRAVPAVAAVVLALPA
jgi:hypothetical protein